eukprot:TRINITY_DN35017_c0_g1_i1.p1 TRINITY_DN35017_c0_g1~~TRINITY_DN35017_c0_g1_i1.p1  ORF type:complete len:166 (+),score=22.03 TRINITY_DN35017_c0_g1_i1:91-588(+)
MPTSHNVQEVIQKLGLQPHPEGGYYKQTYRSAEEVDVEGAHRRAATDIYFLITDDMPSRFHRLRYGIETWHFYYGSAMEVVEISTTGVLSKTRLGPDFLGDDVLQHSVPHGCWFAARMLGAGYALVGCTCAPGFEFSDFILADRPALNEQYPHLAGIISELTPEP